MSVLASLVIAFSTYSRIPMPRVDWSDENRRYAFCFFPLIGLCIGLLLGVWLVVCDAAMPGPLCRGSVAALIPFLLTGGIHMDGLMDTADAVACYGDRKKRLAVMKDSHVGAFAVMACASYLLLSAGLTSELTQDRALPVAACFIASRAMSAALSVSLQKAHSGMLEEATKGSGRRTVLLASAGYLLLCCWVWFCADILGGALCITILAMGTLLFRRWAYAIFGGVTGDLMGAYLQGMELLMIAVWAIRRAV